MRRAAKASVCLTRLANAPCSGASRKFCAAAFGDFGPKVRRTYASTCFTTGEKTCRTNPLTRALYTCFWPPKLKRHRCRRPMGLCFPKAHQYLAKHNSCCSHKMCMLVGLRHRVSDTRTASFGHRVSDACL